jgi:predicted lactoylglutathione lyase
MPRKIFVNLPVSDLEKSMSFFRALGFEFNPQFTDETAACMVISDTIYVMLLTHAKFAQFTPRPIADAHKTTQVLNALSFDSRDEVDRMIETARANGGRQIGDTQDHGFMYHRAFADPDGHIWEIFWMDPQAILPGAAG